MARKNPLIPPWLEIEQYINTFRVSSDRVRVVLYAVVTASLIVGGLQWSIRDGSWPWTRYGEWEALHDARARHDQELEKRGKPLPVKPGPALDIAERRRSEDEELAHSTHLDSMNAYSKAFVERFGLVNVPLFGLSFDINDLGVVGGTLISVLVLLLVFCVARQHENFYLCAFKVRRLRAADDDHERGDSAANFLYHALAMTQVLNHPPSLARWAIGTGARALMVCRMITFFLPAFAYFSVLFADLRTSWVDASSREMLAEYFLMIVILVECVFVSLYVSAVQYKWQDLFYEINPRLAYTPHSKWRRWIDWKVWARKNADVEKLAEAALIGQPLPPDEERHGVAHATNTMPVPRAGINDEQARRRMATALHRAIRRQARGTRFADGGRIDYADAEILANDQRDQRWTMRVRVPYVKRVRVDRSLRIDDARLNRDDSAKSD